MTSAGVNNVNTDTDFYSHKHFNENNLFKNRTAITSEDTTTIPIIKEKVQVGKHIVERGVSV